MRLIEFADPSLYTLSTENAANFLKQLERIWPRDAFHQRLGDGHSSLPASGITSAAPIVAFATAQCNARPRTSVAQSLPDDPTDDG